MWKTATSAFIICLVIWSCNAQGKCDWWDGKQNGRMGKTILKSCQSSINFEFKVKMKCSMYSAMDNKGIRITVDLESINQHDLRDTFICFKMTNIKVSTLTEADEDIFNKATEFPMTIQAHYLLQKITSLAITGEFNRNVTLAKSDVSPSCLQNILKSNGADSREWDINVSSCLSEAEIHSGLLLPEDITGFITNFFDIEIIYELLNLVDQIYLKHFNGSIDGFRISLGRNYRKLSMKTLNLLKQKGIKNIALPNNEIKTLSKDDFPYMPSLQYLDFSNCQITYVDPLIFQNLPNLEILNLGANNLTEFHFPVISSLKINLKVLLLNGNIPSTLGKFNLVGPLESLESLDLSDMDLSNQWSKLKDLNNLRFLSMRNCSIESINQEILPLTDLGKLEIIDFSYNKLTVVELNEEIVFKRLKVFNISFNNISALSLRNGGLDVLDASHNQINWFKFGSSIRFINFSNNAISSWNEDSFDTDKDIDNDSEIDLSYNNIGLVNSGMLRDLSKFKQVDLRNNSFDCGSCEFIDWILRPPVHSTILHVQNYTCSSPPNVVDKRVIDMKINSQCNVNEATKVKVPVWTWLFILITILTAFN